MTVQVTTMRLRLEPIGPANAPDLWLVHNDDAVSPWYDNEKPSLEQAERWAEFMGDSWRQHGVHKWIAYDRASGELVGRGGLSRTPVDDDWGQIYPFLPAESWVGAEYEIRHNVRSRAVMERIGMRYAGEIRSRGMVEGVEGVQDDAPFAVCVLLRSDWERSAATHVAL